MDESHFVLNTSISYSIHVAENMSAYVLLVCDLNRMGGFTPMQIGLIYVNELKAFGYILRSLAGINCQKM